MKYYYSKFNTRGTKTNRSDVCDPANIFTYCKNQPNQTKASFIIFSCRLILSFRKKIRFLVTYIQYRKIKNFLAI